MTGACAPHCQLDPEGDYSTLDDIVTVGSRVRAPHIGEILERLSDPDAQVVVNLLGMALREHPDFFSQLFPRLQALRAPTGRPHWLLIDEVHHLLPAQWGLAPSTLPQRLGETILITFQPREVSASILAMVDTAVAVGSPPEATLAELAAALGTATPEAPTGETKRNEVVVWQRTTGGDPFTAVMIPARSERLRHLRKYAEGNLGSDSFFPRPRRPDEPQGAKPDLLLRDGGRSGRRHLDVPPPKGRLFLGMREVIKDGDLAREVVALQDASHLDLDRESAPGPRRHRQALHASNLKRRVVDRPSALVAVAGHRVPPRRSSPSTASTAGTISLVTKPCSWVNSSITSKDSAMFWGVSMTMVTTGTWRVI